MIIIRADRGVKVTVSDDYKYTVCDSFFKIQTNADISLISRNKLSNSCHSLCIIIFSYQSFSFESQDVQIIFMEKLQTQKPTQICFNKSKTDPTLKKKIHRTE